MLITPHRDAYHTHTRSDDRPSLTPTAWGVALFVSLTEERDRALAELETSTRENET